MWRATHFLFQVCQVIPVVLTADTENKLKVQIRFGRISSYSWHLTHHNCCCKQEGGKKKTVYTHVEKLSGRPWGTTHPLDPPNANPLGTKSFERSHACKHAAYSPSCVLLTTARCVHALGHFLHVLLLLALNDEGLLLL